MKMEMEMYWAQHKVFFVATLALFPERLDRHEVNPWFYEPYFVGKDLNFIELELEEYRKADYVKYEKTHALYKISKVNEQKATNDLTKYLQKWQRNELLSLPANKPPDSEYQQALLLNAITRAYANHQKEPRITLQDIYGEPSSYKYEPPFWELVLSYHLLSKKIKIKYMDYDRRVDGLYDDNVQPVIDFQIVGKELEQAVAPHTAQTKANPTTHSARVVLGDDGFVHIKLDNDVKYFVNKLRYESAPYNFLRYVLDNPNRSVGITEVHDNIKGCKAKSDMTELVRQCGFNEILKTGFFIGTTKHKVRLTQDVNLNSTQLDLLKNGNRKES